MAHGKRNTARGRVALAALSVLMACCVAVGITLPLLNRAQAQTSQPGTPEYYADRWEEAKIQFGSVSANTGYTSHQGSQEKTKVEGPWMLEDLNGKVKSGVLSQPWDGAPEGTAPEDTVNGGSYDADTNPWKVSTAQQLRWCVVNGNSFQLQKDIDLGGYMGMNWETPDPVSQPWTVDGNGYTIYNYYSSAVADGTSLFGANTALTVKNLRIAHAWVTSTGANTALLLSAAQASGESGNTLTNCAVETAWVRGQGGAAGFSAAGGVRDLQNSYLKDVAIYGTNGVAGVLAQNQAAQASYTYAGDCVVIATETTAGGFAANMSGGSFTQCFTSNVDVYCNEQGGGFYAGSSDTQGTTFTRCFASGRMEGREYLGGFLAGSTGADCTVAECYATTMTGLVPGGSSVGGFVGSAGQAGAPMQFQNCYAAGEVGDVDTDVSQNRANSRTVGGFVGQNAANLTYTNCYYDKQTSAMREWEAGEARDGGEGDISGITGLLTTTSTKAGTGMTDAAWVALGDGYNTDLGTGFYPQLDVFSNPEGFTGYKGWTTDEAVQNQVKSYSASSVSTVLLNVWDQDYQGNPLSQTTYDTVRDLTSKFTLSSTKPVEQGRPDDQPPINDPTQDIALGKTTTASSQYNATTYKAANVVDGDPETSWCNGSGTGVGEWVQVDLGEETNVAKISVSLPNSPYIPMSYEVQVSKDGKKWETAAAYQDVGAEYRHTEFPWGRQMRYVKVQTTKLTGNWSYINSIEVYEMPKYPELPAPPPTLQISQWERCGVTGQGTLANGSGAKSSAFQVSDTEHMYDVSYIYKKDDTWYGDHTLPGIDWMRVTTDFDGASGIRQLRVCPTVGIDAGLSRNISTGETYDHADDVRLVYSTSQRLIANVGDFTYGVYPDDPVSTVQQQLLHASAYANPTELMAKYLEAGQNDAYANIDVSHMERTGVSLTQGVPVPATEAGGKLNEVVIKKVLSEDRNGNIIVSEKLDLTDPQEADRWNGKSTFSTDDRVSETYALEYTWSLSDGRYVQDIKRVEKPVTDHMVSIHVQNEGGHALSNKAFVDAYSISTPEGGTDPSIKPEFGGTTRAEDWLLHQARTFPAAVSWKLVDNVEPVLELRITLQSTDGTMKETVTVPAQDLPQTDGETRTFHALAPYRVYSYDKYGNVSWTVENMEKKYTISRENEGVYTVRFDQELMDFGQGILVQDVDMDIQVQVILDAADPSYGSTVFTFNNTRKDSPWVGDSTDVINEMPSLQSTGGGAG